MELETAPLFLSSMSSAGLAFGIAYLMLRSFRVTRRDYLLGFPIGPLTSRVTKATRINSIYMIASLLIVEPDFSPHP